MTEDLLLNLPPGSLGAGVPFYPSTEVSLAAARLIAQAEQIQAGIVAYPDDAVIGVPVGGGGALPESITDDFAADSGLWLDGNLAAAAMTVSGGKGIWAPTYGSEIHTEANAASDPNGNEANGAGTWVALNIALAVEAVDVSVGSYALKATADGGVNPRLDRNFAATGVQQFRLVTLDAKSSVASRYISISSTFRIDAAVGTDWTSCVLGTLKDANNYNVTGWVGVTNGDVFLLDNVSVKPITTATVFRVQRIYYPSTVSAKIWLTTNTMTGVTCLKNVDNWVAAYLYPHNTGHRASLIKCVAGTYSVVLTQSSVTYSAGAALDLIPAADFQSWSVNYNDAEIIASQAVTDFAAAGEWYAGLSATYDAGDVDVVGFDDFSATRVEAAPPF